MIIPELMGRTRLKWMVLIKVIEAERSWRYYLDKALFKIILLKLWVRYVFINICNSINKERL
jgi:hypothetical protein